MVHWRHRACNYGLIGVIAEGHDVGLLVLLPLVESLTGAFYVERRVVRLVDQFLRVITLIVDAAIVILNRRLARLARFDIGLSRRFVRHGYPPHHDIAGPPGLRIKHVEGEPLVLHAEVEDVGVATLRFANGAIGVIEATTSAWPGLLKKTEIHGTQGTAVVEQDDILRWEFMNELDSDAAVREQFKSGSSNTGGAADPKAISFVGHRDQLQDFVQSIQENRDARVDGIDGRKSVEIILAIYQAAWTKQTVTLPLPCDPVRPS